MSDTDSRRSLSHTHPVANTRRTVLARLQRMNERDNNA
jgi:hypothetical protein